MSTIAKVIKRNMNADVVVQQFVEIGSMNEGEQSINPIKEATRYAMVRAKPYSDNHQFFYFVTVTDTIAAYNNANYKPVFIKLF